MTKDSTASTTGAPPAGPHPHVGEFEFPAFDVAKCPFPYFAAMRAEAPVYKHPDRNEYIVSRREDISFIAKNSEIFSNAHLGEGGDRVLGRGSGDDAKNTPSNVFFTDPPEHNRKRKLLYPMFSLERQRTYEPMIQGITNALIDDFIERGEVDFRTEFADLLPLHLICDILALPREDIPIWRPFGESEGLGARYLDEEGVRIEEENAIRAMAYVEEQVRARLEHPGDDFLSEFVHSQVERDGAPDIPYLVQEASISLLTAGNVTTTHMLASTMMLLLENPDQLKLVSADHALIKPMIEESLRLECPAQWVLRHVTQDTELGGVAIPEGAQVLIIWASGSRDEEFFEDPDRFWIERPNAAKHHLAFGNGRHTCVGAPLARQVGRLSFEIILSRLANMRLIEEPEAIDSIAFRGPKSVRFTFDRA